MLRPPKPWPLPPHDWRELLPSWCSEGVRGAPEKLRWRVEELEAAGKLCPPLPSVWRAFECTSPDEVNVVLLGQDPYHGMRQAHGLAFSVEDPLLPWPPSLRNVFKERASDCGLPVDRPANLEDWARQGVLLLNASLTTEMGRAGAHQGLGWEEVVESALLGLMARRARLVWILWGRPAQDLHRSVVAKMGGSRDQDVCLRAPHPSPLSAYRGFGGSRPFTQTNTALQAWGERPVVW